MYWYSDNYTGLLGWCSYILIFISYTQYTSVMHTIRVRNPDAGTPNDIGSFA